jgi:DUF1009 family protein
MPGNKFETIGIIAGGGQLPLLFAKAASNAGLQVIAAAHENETNPELANQVNKLEWIKLGQLGKIIKFFKQENVAQTVMAGSITKTNIFKDIRPDLKGLGLWNKINIKQDDAILRAVAEGLAKEGIEVVASTRYLPELLFPKGVLTRKKPSKAQQDDIRFGWQMARAVGELDIGQCIVVRNQTVLAVEAIEGTDATIKRGGMLGKEKAVVIKLRKPNQDIRFDQPAVGITTIETMAEAKAAVLAVEANHALLFDREQVMQLANNSGIIVVGVQEKANGDLSF